MIEYPSSIFKCVATYNVECGYLNKKAQELQPNEKTVCCACRKKLAVLLFPSNVGILL